MWSTRVGYAGGAKESPTYGAIGDHSECIEVDFDPAVISYEELLELFWEGHDATARPYANQYASLILVRDDAQFAAAQESLERYERATGQKVWTQIEKLDRFYPAEDYHQKYRLQNTPALMREFRAMYPSDEDLVASTAAARVNGYLAGASDDCDLLRAEIDRYGLSETARADLLARCGQEAAACAPAVRPTEAKEAPLDSAAPQ